jgi:non-ribosomal peptide synthetase component F/acyl carrier protein
MIYTSGSTGQPKGTGVPHRAVSRLVKQTNFFDLVDGEVFLQLAPLAFDASTFEIWGSLLNGVHLAIAPPQTPSLAELASTIKRYRVSTLWLTAGLFHLMVDEHLDDLKDVRQLLAGGDVLSPPHVRKYLGASNGTLINGYGPTESTTFACCYSMTSDTEIRSSVPIGFPIANTQAYVLDEYLRPAPLGVIGDLYLAGDGLARGYINQPELTAEKFLPHPYSDEPGARLYRTGDLARYLPDGCIEFVGRNDLQVKIRGYRIELGEIELMLTRHPAVRECVVVVRGEDKRLVAYLTLAGQQTPTTRELREFLVEKLPDYMVPALYVQLDQLPLTPNGKIDRRALPDPENLAIDHDHECVAPNTEVEAALVSIWEDILGAKQVSLTDNFFDLGGHSLLATQLISRVRERFRIELPLRTVFEMPRLDEFAAVVETSAPHSARNPIIRPAVRNGQVPLSFAQQRLWFLHQLVPDSPFYNIPTAMRLTGRLDQRALTRALSEIVRRHEVLRTAFTTVQGEPVQEVRPSDPIKISVVDLRSLPELEREPAALKLATAESLRPFDLSQPPLLRVLQLQLDEDDQIICLTMHHIVSDGWSTTIFIREIVALYEAFVQGKTSPLPELPIQYADFAAWQREWLHGKVLDEQLRYWRRQLEGAPTVLELAGNRERPAVQTHRGARQRMEIDGALLAQLKELGHEETSTLFMVLLATFQVLLSRYSGQEDILVGSAVANRNRAETENLIGFFVNTIVLRGVLTGNPTFRELLRQAREVTLGAYAHQDLPFERLVDELQPERELSRQPLFQVMFALQNMPREDLELPGLKLSRVPLADLSAKFDLMLVMYELDDGLIGALEYNSDLFDESTVAGIARHFRTLLESVVADPDTRIQELKMLSDEEHQLLDQPITLNEFQASFSF